VGIPLIKKSIHLLKTLDQLDIAKALENDVSNFLTLDINN
ncbi:transcriptional regulator, partial [Listeria monocytogenes]|nr:transcriptional regulator [Listeria monocytogenes]